MVTKWATVTVGEVADSISETHKRSKDRLIFLNTSDVSNGEIVHSIYSEVRTWPGQAKKSIMREDILMSEIRPANGRWAYVDSDAEDYVVSTKLMVIRSRKDKVVPRFLYHFLTCSQTTHWLQHLAESRSGTFPQITFDQISELEIALPPLRTQVQIAGFLDAISHKIKLNRKMNETLEAIAKALFKSWFVDFDPVRAKSEGRDTGLPSHIADLFPDSFEDSDLGEIPRGWTVGSLLEQAQLLSGGTPRTDRPEYWHGSIPWASAKDVSQCGSCYLISTERAITKLGLENSATQIIPAFSTVVVARGATTGRLTLFGTDIAMNQTCYALRSTLECNFALYCKARQVMDNLVQTAHGSVFDTITTSTFQASRVVLAPQDVIHRFEHMSEPLFRQILTKEHESKSLATLRDTLLPKLISGELRVNDVGCVRGNSINGQT